MRAAAERGDVVRHVGRAAQAELVAVEPDDRHRRLGRNAIDAADQEVVEHDVADDGDAAAGEARRARLARGTSGQRRGGVGVTAVAVARRRRAA